MSSLLFLLPEVSLLISINLQFDLEIVEPVTSLSFALSAEVMLPISFNLLINFHVALVNLLCISLYLGSFMQGNFTQTINWVSLNLSN